MVTDSIEGSSVNEAPRLPTNWKMDSDKRKLKTKKVVRRKSKREKKTENIEIEKIKGLGMSKFILLNCLFVCLFVF